MERKRSTSEKSETLRKQSSETVDRPKTSSGTAEKSALLGKRNQSDTNLSKKPPGATYSLTPTLNHGDGRRASQSSKVTITKAGNTSSIGGASPTHNRSSSATSALSATGMRNRPPSRREQREGRSILDEVEGTLSATITELQELNSVWHSGGPPVPEIHPAFREQMKSPSSAASPRDQSGVDYFSVKDQRRSSSAGPQTVSATIRPASQSLPPTPMNATHQKHLSSDQNRLLEMKAAYDSQKRKVLSLTEENEQLKQQLSFALKKMAEADAVRAERDKFERESKDARAARDSIAEDLRTAQLGFEAAENRLHAVEARLEEANQLKVDVLEHNNELQERMAAQKQRLSQLSREVEELRERPDADTVYAVRRQSIEVEAKNRALEEQVRAKGGRTDLAGIVADLKFRLDDAARGRKERDDRIHQLEATVGSLTTDLERERATHADAAMLSQQAQQRLLTESQQSALRIADLQQKAAAADKASRAALQERDKFEQLLLAEFRRTAIEIHGRQHPAEPLLSKRMDVDGAVAQIRAKAEAALRDEKDKAKAKPSYDGAEYGDGDGDDARIKELEREVEYHLKDIVLYKLDVKGYKKDLRKAQTRIQELEQWARANGAPPTARDHPPNGTLVNGDGPLTPPRQRPGEKQTFRTPAQYHQPVQPPTMEHEMEQRPSISSQSSDGTVPALSLSSTVTEGSPETPKAELGVAVALKVPHMGKGSVQPETYQPNGSPVMARRGRGMTVV